MTSEPEFAYLPPHAPDLERAVLGAMLLEAPGLTTGLELLRGNEAVFYHPPHRLVFRAVLGLAHRQRAVDMVSVVQQLQADGTLLRAGGPQAVAGLTYQIQSAAHLPTHCLQLVGLYVKRRIIEVGRTLQTQARDLSQDPQEALADAQKSLNELFDALQLKRPRFVGELYDQAVDEIVQATRRGTGITGVPSGLTDLDQVTGGWQPGNLIILAARPGMGKTSSAMAMGRFAAGLGAGRQYPGAFFSLEMGELELVKKLIGTEAGYTTSQLQRGRLAGGAEEAEYIRQKAAALRQVGLLIDDTPGLHIHELRAKATRLKADHDIQWVAVDYLQLMKGEKGGTREQEISSISRGLKLLAKELRIPVIALAQLSRAVETRGGDKRPQLSDLRESGALEQDADLIVFPYRPEYYAITEDAQGQPTEDTTEFIIAKHRNGPLADVLVRSVMKFGRYEDLPDPAAPAAAYRPGPMPDSRFDEPAEPCTEDFDPAA